MRKLKNGESYKKVCNLIIATPEFQELRNTIIERLRAAHFSKFSFFVDTWGSGHTYGVANFVLGPPDCKITYNLEVGEVDGAGRTVFGGHKTVSLSWESVVVEPEVSELVEKVFGVVRPGERRARVPTYFCKPDRVVQVLKEDPYHWNLHHEVQSTIERLNQELATRVSSPEFKEGMQQKRDDYTVEEIVKTLSRFRDASPETLKRALDTFVMHDIMER